MFTNTVATEGKQPKDFNKTELRTITFDKTTNYFAQIVGTFDAQLNGLTTYSYFLMSDELKNGTAYNGWDFSGPEGAKLWDSPVPEDESLWFSTNQTLLWST